MTKMKKLFNCDSEVLGDGKVVFDWNPRGTYLAAAGTKRRVTILDRMGKVHDEVIQPPPEFSINDTKQSCCLHLKWDPSGEHLAMVPSGSSVVLLWSASNHEIQRIDSEFKTQEVTAIAWSRDGSSLAIGMSKGNLTLLSVRERKKVPFLSKHSKRITCAVWNKDNLLALGSADKLVTISHGLSGELLKHTPVKGEPQQLSVSSMKDDRSGRREENTFTVVTNKKFLYIINYVPDESSKGPLELAFQESYGPLQHHLWFGDGFILLGFRSGQVVVISSHSREVAEEVHSDKFLDTLVDVSFSPSAGRAVIGGGNQVKVIEVGGDYGEVKSESIELAGAQEVHQVNWGRNGQVLTYSTTSGLLSCHMVALPAVYGIHKHLLMHLTSLLEAVVVDVPTRNQICRAELAAEPALCGIGPRHMAVGINNQVWYYLHDQCPRARLVSQRTYLGSVQSIHLNATHAILLVEGRVVTHPIEVGPDQHADDHAITLEGPSGGSATVTCCAVTSELVITASSDGNLATYAVGGTAPVNEFKHSQGLLKVYPQPGGQCVVFLDDHCQLLLYHPLDDTLLTLGEVQGEVEDLLWDLEDNNVFVVVRAQRAQVYVYTPVSITGSKVTLIDQQSISATHTPVVLQSGVLSCRLKSGTLDQQVLETHRALKHTDSIMKNSHFKRFQQCLKLFHLQDAWNIAMILKNADTWRQLGQAALEVLEVELAMAAYRFLGDASMVMSLEGLMGCEDRNLLGAHILVLMEQDFKVAEDLFLRSSRPQEALDMRKDLKHWQEALVLAEKLDPQGVSHICKERAAALEMMGEYQQARAGYQQALEYPDVSPEVQSSCQAGLARMTLQVGDLRQGRQLVIRINSPQLYQDCGAILEGLGHLQDAAEMYERGTMYEKAAMIYIQSKNFTAAAPLMAKIASPKLHIQFAKAKEAEGKYADAANAYEAAGDYDNVVRLCLDRINNPQKAYTLVRKSASVVGAGMLTKYCLQVNDWKGAVEFLLLAKQVDQAFDVAQAHQEMDTFAHILQQDCRPEEAQRIGNYNESRGEFEKAADVWSSQGEHRRAAQLYLKNGGTSCLDKVVHLVETSGDMEMGRELMEYISAALEGQVRDSYRFKTHIAMGQYVEAAKAAVEVARFEQEEGNYKVAHSKLLSTHQQLTSLGHTPPQELQRALLLLHSYVLVKSLVSISDHHNAARMLVRVSQNISKFPKHVVPILTSTVIECHRAGLTRTAFEYASLLMRPEYRKDVAEKYRKKIELMVRKPDRSAEPEEPLTDCPFCGLPGPETEMQCISCQNVIPFDLATGKRMTLLDWSQCPQCKLPCSSRQFLAIVEVERRCPLCMQEVHPQDVKPVVDPLGRLKTSHS